MRPCPMRWRPCSSTHERIYFTCIEYMNEFRRAATIAQTCCRTERPRLQIITAIFERGWRDVHSPAGANHRVASSAPFSLRKTIGIRL
ncbi:hypothetical protein NPIL_597711 [Nephila pilipes]|uniref:Uncharacterized protein n=1 Tax=Nephila pilipes TaxID=299642 RepID=A0A8X6MF91_NEPPI|nr:hypothetical protein NPIL_597711 [Nephila pilipes]